MDGVRDVLACYGVATVAACAMRRAAEARGCFNFSVAVGEEEEVAASFRDGAMPAAAMLGRMSSVNIQLMSWQSRLRCAVDAAERPACRVMYEVQTSKLPAMQEPVARKGVVEWLVLTEDGCEQLVAGLVASSKVLPRTARSMCTKTVGFLYFTD